MHTKTKIILSMLLISTAISANAESNISEKIENINKINSQFSQKIFDNNNNVIQHSSGVIKLDKKYGFNWTIFSPYSQEVIYDKRKIYSYDPDLKQVTIDSPRENNNFLSIFFSTVDIEDRFEIDKLNEGYYLLRPRVSNGVSHYIVKFNDKNIEKIIIKDNMGQKTIISISDKEAKDKIDREDFIFNKEKGVDVFSSF